jgi:hypothetical protein
MAYKDLRLLLVILLGMTVFVISMKWVLGNRESPRFHEIIWDTRSITKDIVAKSEQDTVSDTTVRYPIAKTKNYTTNHLKSLSLLKQKIAGLNDSSWEAYVKPRLFMISDSLLIESINLEEVIKNKDKQYYLKNVKVVFVDEQLPLRRLQYKTDLPIKVYRDSDEFMSKYPIFGKWALLLIFQAVLYCILAIMLSVKLFTCSSNPAVRKLQIAPVIKIIYIVCILLACYVLYSLVIKGDGGVISKSQYFMAELDHIFQVINGLGYFVAGLCLTGMLFSIIEINKAIAEKITDPVVIKYLDERLKLFLGIAALILSLAVFTTGTFFSALNSLAFIVQLSRAWGYSPIPSDFVVLYGLIHTFLLLVFYIPAKYQLDVLKANMVPAPPPQNWSIVKKLADIAIAGSPLLAGMLQSVIDIWN